MKKEDSNALLFTGLAVAGIYLIAKDSETKPIGDTGYSKIEIWILASINKSYGGSINYTHVGQDTKELLQAIDVIRKKLGFQELGESYFEKRIAYDYRTKTRGPRYFVITTVEDDKLNGESLKLLWLNALIKRYPSLKFKYYQKGFGITVLKNSLD